MVRPYTDFADQNIIVSEMNEAYVCRILYGKMFVKTGKGTSGKQHSANRQSLVFRFLSGCRPEELKEFIDLIFAPFTQFISGEHRYGNS